MQTKNYIQLKADENKFLTDGKRYLKTVYVEPEQVENWQEVSDYELKKHRARMTPREFILKLMDKGVTKAQIEALNQNEQVWAELNFATTILRANSLLDELCGQFGLTPADVDEMFGL